MHDKRPNVLEVGGPVDHIVYIVGKRIAVGVVVVGPTPLAGSLGREECTTIEIGSLSECLLIGFPTRSTHCVYGARHEHGVEPQEHLCH